MAFCFLLNALLDRESWARERLVPFAGQAVEVELPLAARLRIAIGADGRVEPADAEPAARVALGAIEGGPLADEIRYLARRLRWDFEEELSRLVGDIAAHRIAGAARGFARWQADAAQRLAEALGAYATDESTLLVRRSELTVFANRIETLVRELKTLESRITRLA